MEIRKAKHLDVAGMMTIKAGLAISWGESQDAPRPEIRGGFLLGSTREQYEKYVRAGGVKVLADPTIRGFSIVMDDCCFREVYLDQMERQLAAMLLGAGS